MGEVILKERDYMFDNLRIFLMFGVVLAHGLETARSTSESIALVHGIMLCFLMPMFVFVTGYFAKGMADANSPKRVRILNILLLYIITQLIKSVLYDNYTLFHPHYAGWYLVGMVVWYYMLPMFSKVNAVWSFIITIVLGVLLGLDPAADDMLQISRVVCFVPFFLLGFYCTKDTIDTVRYGKYRLVSFIVFIICIVLYVFIFRDIIPYGVFHANKCYDAMDISAIQGCLYRLWWYIFSAISGVGLLSIIPRKKMFFSTYGTRTLPIYIVHTIVYCVVSTHTDWFKQIGNADNTFFIFFIISIIVTIVCGLKPINWVFNKFMSLKFDFLLKGRVS